MKKRKIFIIIGHPDRTSSVGGWAREYEKGARDGGHDVRLTYLGDLNFDPILHRGYKSVQPLEPDLVKVQEDIRWCEHLVIFYPNWFVAMPALLKGMFERIWLPGFAYHFKEHSLLWVRLLKGRSARVFVTMDSQPILERLFLGDFMNEVKRGILRFAGFSPVRVTKIGPMKTMTPLRHEYWNRRMREMGERCR